MIDPLEGVDRTQLLADIKEVVYDRLGEHRDAAEARLRKLVEPPAPAECGHQPEGVVKAVSGLQYLNGGPSRVTEAITALAKVRCHLPAGHHAIDYGTDSGCRVGTCDADADDPIHTARHDYGDPT